MSAYQHHFAVQDEYGVEECWEVHYRRMTAKGWLTCLAPDGQRETPREVITRVSQAIPSMVFRVMRNGQEVDLDELPESVEVMVFTQHPSFRGRRKTQGDRPGPR